MAAKRATITNINSLANEYSRGAAVTRQTLKRALVEHGVEIRPSNKKK